MRVGNTLRDWKHMALTGLVAATLMVVISPAAEANWFAASNYSRVCALNGNITDDKNVEFHYVDPSTDMQDAANWLRSERLDPTSLDTFYTADLTKHTDIVMRDRYYTDWCETVFNAQWTSDGVFGLRGVAACYATTENGRCDQQVVRLSNHFLDAHGDGGDKWIVGHEVGHSIGLRHRNVPGFMNNDSDVSARMYLSHDREHINSNWSTEPPSGDL